MSFVVKDVANRRHYSVVKGSPETMGTLLLTKPPGYDTSAKHHHRHDGNESDGKHHCAAYDSQTLSMAMPAPLLNLPVIDKTNAAINSYLTYQASIEAYRPFDVRGPPNS